MAISKFSVHFSILLYINVVSSQDTCYWRANTKASSTVIPCRLPVQDSQHVSCCQIGDLCLSNNACWNPSSNVTYLYGCTDPTYSDPSCPWKCGPDFANVPWAGLNFCYDANNTWICRHPTSNTPAIEYVIGECITDSPVAFEGPNSLAPYAFLPKHIGGSTTLFSQVDPTSFATVSGTNVTQRTSPTMYMPTTVQYFIQNPVNQGQYTSNLFLERTKQASSVIELTNIQSLRKKRSENQIGPSTIFATVAGLIGVGLITLSTIVFVRKINSRDFDHRRWNSLYQKSTRDENEPLVYTNKIYQTSGPAKPTVESNSTREGSDQDVVIH